MHAITLLVFDSLGIGSFGFLRVADEGGGEVDGMHFGAEAGELAGVVTFTASDVETAQAVKEEAFQGRRGY